MRKVLPLLLFFALPAQAEDDLYRQAVEMIHDQKGGETATKTLIREYTYDAGASDSKITARKAALKEVKRRALSEIGVHVRSYLDLQSTKTSDGVEKAIDNRIQNVTAGTVQTKILAEDWTGDTYYVKARLSVDAESVAEGIAAALEAEASKEDVARLEEIVAAKEKSLATKSDKLQALEKKAANRAMRLEAREDRVAELRGKVERLQQRLARMNAEEERARTKLGKIRRRIERASNKAWELVERRMTPEEVIKLVGAPRSSLEHSGNRGSWNYGRTWVHWRNGIVLCVSMDPPSSPDYAKFGWDKRACEHSKGGIDFSDIPKKSEIR